MSLSNSRPIGQPRLASLTSLFIRIGNLTWGGGDPTMAALQRELVEKRAWLTAEQYGLAYSLARVTPGTNVLAFCAAGGWLMRRWWGAILAVFAASVPSALVAAWLLVGYRSAERYPLVKAAFATIASAVAGMMLAGVLLLVKPQWRTGTRARVLLIATLSFTLAHGLSFPPIPILAAAALAGYYWKES